MRKEHLMENDIISICPKCGDYNDSFIICVNCGTRKIKTEYTHQEEKEIRESCEYWFDYETRTYHPILEEFYNELREKYVFHSTQFDKNEYNKFTRIRDASHGYAPEEDKQLYIEYSNKQEQARLKFVHGYREAVQAVRCPECGSTQIQMVNRKWTPLMGVFTNKDDRVCMKCKNKF